MNALGSTAFSPELTAESLWQAARLIRNEHPEESEELDDFAHDLAAIRNLYELKS